jgi:endonuclease/exonuclease/phosphatase (EEP) superfamily protein YafD
VAVAGVGSKVTGISWVLAGGLAAWAVARITAADRIHRTETPLVPLVSFTPQVAAVAPWTALGLRLAGQRGPAAMAAVATATLGLVVRTRSIPKRQPGVAGPVLKVLSLNLCHGRADAEIVVARVRQLGADVLFLQEFTAGVASRLQRAGLDDVLPHTRIEPVDGWRGLGIYSRFPLHEGPPVALAPTAQPTALLELPSGETVELICVHPSPPTRAQGGGTGQWREQLAALPRPGRLPRVLAGDFNATLDHAAFRDVLHLGYADAALQAGTARTPTWGPAGKKAVLTLDHILVDHSCAVLACSVHPVPGSDHRAVYAEIQLPALLTRPRTDAAYLGQSAASVLDGGRRTARSGISGAGICGEGLPSS